MREPTRHTLRRALAPLLLTLTVAGCDDLPLGGGAGAEPNGVEVTAGGQVVFRALGISSTGSGITLPRNTSRDLRVTFLTGTGAPIDMAGGGYSLRGTVLLSTVASFESTGADAGRVTARGAGTTTLSLDLMRGAERRYSAPPVPIVVTP